MNLKAKSRGLYWLGAVLLIFCVAAALLFSMNGEADAKGNPTDQTVATFFIYLKGANGEEVLISQNSVEEMYNYYLEHGDQFPLYNYSVLDNYVTPVHQEAKGFTVDQMLQYAVANSEDTEIQGLGLGFEYSDDIIAFWEMDDTQYDALDTYTYDELYGVKRYNFPALYEQWDFNTASYKDKDAIWNSRTEVPFLLSIVAFSQRYMATAEKYDQNDYSMEGYWDSQDLLDAQRTVRLMVGMTQSEFENKKSTANNTRYWNCYMLLSTEKTAQFESRGTVATPTYYVIDGDASDIDEYAAGYFYYFFACEDDFANLYYNQNLASMSYMPTEPYDGQAIAIQKATDATIPNITGVNFRAVADGYADAGPQYAMASTAEPTLLVEDSYSDGNVIFTLSYSTEIEEWLEGLTLTLNGHVLSSEDYEVAQNADGDDILTLSPSVLSLGTNEIVAESEGFTQTRNIEFQVDSINYKAVEFTVYPKRSDVTVRTLSGFEVEPQTDGSYLLADGGYTYEVSKVNYDIVSERFEMSGSDKSFNETLQANVDLSVYKDLVEGEWYMGHVEYSVANNLFIGVETDEWSVDTDVTRGMFVTALGKLESIDTAEYSICEFTDVQNNEYCAPFVQWAYEVGLVKGVGGTEFAPERGITREEMALIFMRYVEYAGGDVTVTDNSAFQGFADKDKTSSWAVEAMTWATANHVINGDSGNLKPVDNTTRAETAAIFRAVIENIL